MWVGLIESADSFERKKTEVREEEESQPQTAFGRELQHHLFPRPYPADFGFVSHHGCVT